MRGYLIISLLISLSVITIEAFPRQSCDQNGEFPHENDCSKYYICVQNMKKVLQCEDDKHFSMKTKTCEDPKRVGCIDGLYAEAEHPDTLEEVEDEEGEIGCEHVTHSPSVVTKPSEPTISEIVPEATESVPEPTENVSEITESIPEATEIISVQPETEPTETNSSEEVTESSKPTEINPTESETEEVTESSKPTELNTAETGLTEPEIKPTISLTVKPTESGETESCGSEEYVDFECPNETKDTRLYSHPDDCKKFIICVWGRLLVIRCTNGTHFNPEINDCDLSVNAKCDSSAVNPSDETTTSQPEIETTTIESEITTVKEENVISICQLNVEELLAHPNNCAKFISCTGGQPVEMDCPQDLHFNKEKKECDYQWEAGCDTNVISEIPSEEVTKSSAADVECPSDMDELYLLPHLKDCSKFISCVWRKPIVMDCPAGLHFNPKLRVCDWPIVARCNAVQSSSTSKPEVTTKPEASTNKPNESNHIIQCRKQMDFLQLVPHPSNCGKFFLVRLGKGNRNGLSSWSSL